MLGSVEHAVEVQYRFITVEFIFNCCFLFDKIPERIPETGRWGVKQKVIMFAAFRQILCLILFSAGSLQNVFGVESTSCGYILSKGVLLVCAIKSAVPFH